MPTFVKILICLAVVATGFTVYWWMQPPAVISEPGRERPPASTRPVTDAKGFMGPGDRVWVSQFDDRGRLSYRFRAQDYIPQKDGTIRVTKPEAEFFLRGGVGRTRVRFTGASGEVVIQATPEPSKDGGIRKEDFGSEYAQPPRRGRLTDVRIDVYDGDAATEPTMSLAMNNAAFDNETFRIYTEAYTDSAGKQIPADWVRVEVSGKHEFIGYGLTIRWNDRDQRLELLKIAHGEKLVVKDPSLLSAGSRQPKQARVSEPTAGDAVVVPADSESPAPLAAAAASLGPGEAVLAAAAEPAPDSPPPLYVASFKERVYIKQGDQTLLAGDAMNVEFLLDSATRPAKPEANAEPAPAPEVPARNDQDTDPAEPAPAAPPEPVTVFWKGELLIVPRSAKAEEPAKVTQPGDVAVEFQGTPLLLTQKGGEVQCASLTYRASDGSVWIRNSESFPKVLVKQIPQRKPGETSPLPPPAVVSTEAVEYVTASRLATMTGRSTARIPVPADKNSPDAPAGVMEAEWADSATFHLLGEGQDLSVDRATFEGDVIVKHPQMALASQKLELAFDPAPPDPASEDSPAAPRADAPAAASNIRSIVATEGVRCDLLGGENGDQTVVCDRLELTTAISEDGSFYPQVVDASGKVRATDDKQELSAGRVVLTLAPTAKKPATSAADSADALSAPATAMGAIDLKSLDASEGISIRSADGATASGDTLNVVVKEFDQTEVRLKGTPARVVDLEGNAIVGPEIHVFPEAGNARVLGGGSLAAVQKDEDDPADPGRTINVTWSGGAAVNGERSRIDVKGDVVAIIPDRDGTVNTARGERVAIALVPKTAAVIPAGGGAASTTSNPPAASATRALNTAASIAPTSAKPVKDPVVSSSGPAEKKNDRSHEKKPQLAKKSAESRTQPANNANREPAGPIAGRVKMDLFKDKQVGAIALVGEAVVNSNQKAADGALLREFQMQAPALRFDVLKRQLVVPNAGQMLVRDHRPSDAPKDPNSPPAAGQGRGVTAFQWGKSLIYDEQKRRATMSGDVLIVHKPDGQNQLPIRMNADWVSAAFEPADSEPAGDVKAATGDRPADMASALRLTGLSAIGNIRATRDAAELTAHRIDYNPANEWITATGTPRNPATFTEGAGAGSTTAELVQWNAKTWHVRFKNITAQVR